MPPFSTINLKPERAKRDIDLIMHDSYLTDCNLTETQELL
jgi:endonuclease IV